MIQNEYISIFVKNANQVSGRVKQLQNSHKKTVKYCSWQALLTILIIVVT